METIILSKRAALKYLSNHAKSTDICYFLSDDYATLLKLRNILLGKCEILTLGFKFHEAIKEIERDFVNFSHSINFQNQSEIYWGCQIASRNSASVPLLRYAAYFYCAKRFLSENKERIIFVCESVALARLIKKEAKAQGFSCILKFCFQDIFYSVKSFVLLIIKGIYLIISLIAQWGYARSLKNKRLSGQPSSERYLLRSWVTAGSVNKEGLYKDRNFGALPMYLKEQGKDVWILPMFFNLDRKFLRK